MRDLVTSLYWDEDVGAAAERFRHGSEFAEVSRLLTRRLPSRPWVVLDVGAGVGVSSYAFAMDGNLVTAIEPDPSDILGRGAFERLRHQTAARMQCIDAVGEGLPVPDSTFDVVYTRQVLHHASDLRSMAREFGRVLRPGGVVLATREHVISRPDDLSAFLNIHATHKYLGNEHAYLLTEYLDAFVGAGFQKLDVLGPLSSVINRFPVTDAQFARDCANRLERRFGVRIARFLSSQQVVRSVIARYLDSRSDAPGRMYSFLFRWPGRP